ncbi:glutamate racemase [Patescibacteria group bacterium]|nr:glutamate racemase [Patescibacteria group bacterium]
MLGIFDSGIGGLTIARAIKKIRPNQPLVYFGDTARCPWGNKNAQTIKRYTREIVKFLIGQGAREIVMACNTSSALAKDYLEKKFPQIRFYNVIDPVIAKISRELKKYKKSLKVGVIGTQATIESQIFERQLKKLGKNISVSVKACPQLVPLIEKGESDKKIINTVLTEYLSGFQKNPVDYLILGCTHYALLKKPIQQFLGKTKLISSDQETALEVKKNISANLKSKAPDRFYFSQLDLNKRKLIQKIIGQKVWLQERLWKK